MPVQVRPRAPCKIKELREFHPAQHIDTKTNSRRIVDTSNAEDCERKKQLRETHLRTSSVAKLCDVTFTTLKRWITHIHWFNPQCVDGVYYFTQYDVDCALYIAKEIKEKKPPLFAIKPPMPVVGHKTEQKIKFWLINKDVNDAGLSETTGGEVVKTYSLPSEYCLTEDKIMDICHVDEQTARGYLVAKKAPFAVSKLLDLHYRGRILPEKWNHCFINHNGNIEINQVGEISENDVIGLKWERQLYKDHVRTLKIDLQKAEDKIKQLEGYLDQANLERGRLPAANN